MTLYVLSESLEAECIDKTMALSLGITHKSAHTHVEHHMNQSPSDCIFVIGSTKRTSSRSRIDGSVTVTAPTGYSRLHALQEHNNESLPFVLEDEYRRYKHIILALTPKNGRAGHARSMAPQPQHARIDGVLAQLRTSN